MKNAAKTTKQQRGRPFQKGQSGNPAGHSLGSRHKNILAMEALLDAEADTIVRKTIEMAKNGDSLAIRLCLERIIPPRKDRPISFEAPTIATAADALKALGALIEAVAEGKLTPTEASELFENDRQLCPSLEQQNWSVGFPSSASRSTSPRVSHADQVVAIGSDKADRRYS
jgi:hypothetical protein